MKNLQGLKALSPLLVFIAIYTITSIVASDFYKVPITVAFLLSCIYGVAVVGKGSIEERVSSFCRGAGTENIILMILIFVLAGAFASAAKAMGSIDATVNLALYVTPEYMILAGLFLASCFISLAIGTSVGTIAALVPIAVGLAEKTGGSTAFLTAIAVGGAFFGDNLSFISDTTIVATKTQGCMMKDKFRANFPIALPAAIIVLVIYIAMGFGVKSTDQIESVQLLKVVPYIVVLVTAIMGVNVMAVLVLGLVSCAVLGLADGSYDIYGLFSSMGEGILVMSELIIVTVLAAGLLSVIKEAGGINYIIDKMTRHITGKRGAELSIGFLVALVDICTANNTIAILTLGDISKHISDKFGIDPRKAASILDTFSCVMQGLIPYGAQLLIAAGLAKISPIEILPHLYYPVLLGFIGIISILLRFPKKYS